MAEYRIAHDDSTVTIDLTDVSGERDKLVRAFGECQTGQCSCPTDEFQKLESLGIEQGDTSIRLLLQPKPGASFDLSAIANCLDYTTSEAARTDE